MEGLWGLLLLFLCTTLCVRPGTSALATFCKVTQRNLTCYFPQDLSEKKTSFALYYRNAQLNVSEIPLACNWARGKPHCDAHSGIEAPVTATNEFTVKLPPEANGTYTCRPIPFDSNMVTKPCHFYGQDTMGGMSTPGNESQKPPTGDTTNYYLLAALVVISTMFVLMLLGTAVYAIILRRRKRKEGLPDAEKADLAAKKSQTEEQEQHLISEEHISWKNASCVCFSDQFLDSPLETPKD